MDKEADTHEQLIWPMSYNESLWAGILTVFHPEEYTFLGFKKITKARWPLLKITYFVYLQEKKKKKEQRL